MPLRKTLLFVAAFFAFFVCIALLFGGGDRLIATDAPQTPMAEAAALPALPATLDVAVDRAALPGAPARTESVGQRPAPCDIPRGQCAIAARAPRCDANGNVLCALRYSRSVYAAFALGDMPG